MIEMKRDSLNYHYFYFWDGLYSNLFYHREIKDKDLFIEFVDRYDKYILRLSKDGSGGELINRSECSISEQLLYVTLDANVQIIPEPTDKAKYIAIKRKWTIDKIKKYDGEAGHSESHQ